MPKLIFENCCFCIELRVGCFVIGYLQLVTSVVATILTILMVASGAVFASSSDPDVQAVGAVILGVGIVTLLVFAVFLGFIIALLVGLHKNKPKHVMAYLIYNVIFLVLYLFLFIVNAAYSPQVGDIISRLLGLLFSIYCLLVVRSYYYEMLDSSNRTSRPQI